MKYILVGIVACICSWPAQAQFATPNDRGVSFGHMHLVVADLKLHTDLWTSLFDANIVEKQGYTAVRIADALIFFRVAEPRAPSVDTAIDHFGLKVKNIEDVLSKWRELGYRVDSQSANEAGRATAFITMPGGVKLALSESPDQSASTSMHYIQYSAPNSGTLVDWYVKHFGVEAVDTAEHLDFALVPDTELRFGDSNDRRLPTDGAAIDHVGFEVQDWDAVIDVLRESGVRFEFGPTYIESLDLWVAFVNDPSGVLVEVTHGLDKF